MSNRGPAREVDRRPRDTPPAVRSGRTPGEQLSESEARCRALLQAIADSVLWISRDGRILDCCLPAQSNTGWRAADLLNADIHDSPLPAALTARLPDLIERALCSTEVQIFQQVLAPGDPSRELEVRVVRSGADEVTAVFRELAAQRRAELRDRQAERLVAIGQMLAGLAHESRNAFQRSQACLEMLALEIEDRPDALELVASIQRAQDHLHYIYEEVRSYAAPLQLRLQRSDLQQIWRDTWSHLELERRERNVRLGEETGGLDLECQADPIALEQIFRNVLENAVHACGQGGRITIRCQAGQIADRAAVQIAVGDSGSGFSGEALQKAFEPFYTTKNKGTGLGLAIARRLVQAHEGRIAVGNRAEGGAEVLIVLPRQVLTDTETAAGI